eukprot:238289-Rhodomonas_salina.1
MANAVDGLLLVELDDDDLVPPRYPPTRVQCHVRYQPTRLCPVLTSGMVLRTCYAMSGTDVRYGATRRQSCGSRTSDTVTLSSYDPLVSYA